MQVADFHCDVLAKLLEDENASFSLGGTSTKLDVTLERLREGNVILQTFAVYIPQRLSGGIEPILRSVDLFYEKVLASPGMHAIRYTEDIDLCAKEGKIGALLSLEGVNGLQGSLSALRLLHRLGVRAAGLTWNHANWAADGVMEPRGGGLTEQGRAFVQECIRLGVVLDVSHLSERGFWEVDAMSPRPLIASHSNARSVMDHPRNLNDMQIRALIEGGGLIGVTYVPWFIADKTTVTIDDLLRHIDHICALGGERHLMLGSDFDGIEHHVQGLRHPGQAGALVEALLKRYSPEQTSLFMSGNALRFLKQHLPHV